MLLKAVRTARWLAVAAALCIGLVLAVRPGNYASARVIIVGFWCGVAAALWVAIGHLARKISRRAPAKSGFDFAQRDTYVAAVERSLPSGEAIANFVPVFETSFVEGKFPRSRGTTLHFYGLALTTVGLRWFTFGAIKERRGSRVIQRITPNAILGEAVVRMSEITRVQSSLARCPRIEIALEAFDTGFGSPLVGVTSWDSLKVEGLTVSTHDGKVRAAWSPYREMTTLISNLNSMRSGDFLSTRAAGATDAVERLQRLVDEGALSGEEFDRLKAGFVGSTTKHQESTEARIRQLHGLMKDGILTESEFRQKKWDLLSKPS